MRRTKIVCTLGPATDDYSVLKSMIRAGMNVARLNFSHSTYDEHKRRMDMVKRARKELGVPVAILLDTKGPEIRIRTFKDGKVELKKGDKFTLTTREVEGDRTIVSVSYEDLPQYVKKGTRILVNDGLIKMSGESGKKTVIVHTVM
ncbi:MAG: pyruvate kinase, partial [Clostridiales bacterium]|nr:pyruvate kinase [Clostridiales bacterium]